MLLKTAGNFLAKLAKPAKKSHILDFKNQDLRFYLRTLRALRETPFGFASCSRVSVLGFAKMDLCLIGIFPGMS